MKQTKSSYIRIIEFYLRNLPFINRQIEYRLQVKNTKDPIVISKLYSPIPFAEMFSIAESINKTIRALPENKVAFINMRYRKRCTYDVICDFLCMKRSTLYKLGEETLDDILFNVLLDDLARNSIIHSDFRSYSLK